ncbi:serine/threonine protein kinase [Lujinxingia litoralis]|nr:serine/threonine-protein kinase [Lujinxingia litoralis]
MTDSSQKSPERDALPRRIGERFELQRLLGEGGFGATYVALDLESGRDVAIKVLHLERIEDWKALELFEREARVLKHLDHPRIPDYIDFISAESTGQAYLAQELARGQSIGELLRDGRRFTEAEAKEVARQVLEVLVYLGGLRPQVVHRDLKPDNLLLDGDSISVVDFGAVREVARKLGHHSTVAGTFGYMAPEQLMGRASPASDLFALGMTLIHMLSGVSPDTMEQRRGKPLFREQCVISEGFADLLDQMIEPIMEDRFDSAERCLELLDRLKDAELPRKHRRRPRDRPALPPQETLSEGCVQIVARGPGSWRISIRPPTARIHKALGVFGHILAIMFMGFLANAASSIILFLSTTAGVEPTDSITENLLGYLFLALIIAARYFTYIDTYRGGDIEIEQDTISIKVRYSFKPELLGSLADLRTSLVFPKNGASYGKICLHLHEDQRVLHLLTSDEIHHLIAFLEILEAPHTSVLDSKSALPSQPVYEPEPAQEASAEHTT